MGIENNFFETVEKDFCPNKLCILPAIRQTDSWCKDLIESEKINGEIRYVFSHDSFGVFKISSIDETYVNGFITIEIKNQLLISNQFLS